MVQVRTTKRSESFSKSSSSSSRSKRSRRESSRSSSGLSSSSSSSSFSSSSSESSSSSKSRSGIRSSKNSEKETTKHNHQKGERTRRQYSRSLSNSKNGENNISSQRSKRNDYFRSSKESPKKREIHSRRRYSRSNSILKGRDLDKSAKSSNQEQFKRKSHSKDLIDNNKGVHGRRIEKIEGAKKLDKSIEQERNSAKNPSQKTRSRSFDRKREDEKNRHIEKQRSKESPKKISNQSPKKKLNGSPNRLVLKFEREEQRKEERKLQIIRKDFPVSRKLSNQTHQQNEDFQTINQKSKEKLGSQTSVNQIKKDNEVKEFRESRSRSKDHVQSRKEKQSYQGNSRGSKYYDRRHYPRSERDDRRSISKNRKKKSQDDGTIRKGRGSMRYQESSGLMGWRDEDEDENNRKLVRESQNFKHRFRQQQKEHETFVPSFSKGDKEEGRGEKNVWEHDRFEKNIRSASEAKKFQARRSPSYQN